MVSRYNCAVVVIYEKLITYSVFPRLSKNTLKHEQYSMLFINSQNIIILCTFCN